VVLRRQALVVEVVEGVTPDALADRAECPVDAVVVVALTQPLELRGVLRESHNTLVIY